MSSVAGNAREGQVQAALDSGMDFLVTKPYRCAFFSVLACTASCTHPTSSSPCDRLAHLLERLADD